MADNLKDEKRFLSQSLDQLNISLSSQQQQQLWHYMKLLQKWNRTYNLTAITRDQSHYPKTFA